MKKTVLFIPILLLAGLAHAQIPNGYYDDAQNLNGYQLKTALSGITGNGYINHSYNDLWDVYYDSDVDIYYENDGTVLDVYSENPDGADPYVYNFGDDQCGNYSGEGSCYNREHLMPQSWFNESAPMKSDAQQVYPTDGYVNGQRGHLPFGEVDNPSFTSGNGSKKGPNVYDFSGAYTGNVFEPIDEFKGDIARVYFYMATRYEDQIGSWQNANDGSQNTLNGSSDQVFNNWTLAMLIDWHEQDPVSQRELDRNDAVYDFQGNRNPFIDHPEYVAMIWESDGGGNGEDPSDYIVYEDFNTCADVPDNFTVVSELSPVDWECIDQYGENDTGAMQINSFVDGQQVPSIDWLITTNTVNFDHYTDEELSFYTGATFGNTELQLLYSTDYDGNGEPSDFTWQDVPNVDVPLYPSGENGVVETSFSGVDVSAIEGSNVYLAFKYDTSNGEEATRWTVDNFMLSGTEDMGVQSEQKGEFVLYPNPVTRGNVTIVMPGKRDFTLSVYSLNGRLITQQKRKAGEAKVSTDGLSSGLYLIRISNGNQMVTKRLIVK